MGVMELTFCTSTGAIHDGDKVELVRTQAQAQELERSIYNSSSSLVRPSRRCQSRWGVDVARNNIKWLAMQLLRLLLV